MADVTDVSCKQTWQPLRIHVVHFQINSKLSMGRARTLTVAALVGRFALAEVCGNAVDAGGAVLTSMGFTVVDVDWKQMQQSVLEYFNTLIH